MRAPNRPKFFIYFSGKYAREPDSSDREKIKKMEMTKGYIISINLLIVYVIVLGGDFLFFHKRRASGDIKMRAIWIHLYHVPSIHFLDWEK